jgi:PAS domain S-box-containing protein
MSFNQSIDANKSRKQLIKELADLRDQITAEKQQSKKTKDALNRKNFILEGINRIFHGALICKTEEELGKLCLKVAEEITGSEFGFIREVNEEGLLNNIAMSDTGWKACQMTDPAGHQVRFSGVPIRGIYGKVLREGKGFYTNHPSSHPDRIGPPEGHPALTSFMGVPLIRGGKAIIGMIGVANRAGGYRDKDLEALTALAPAVVQALLSNRAEEKIAQQKDLLQHIFDNIPVLLIMWDSQVQNFFLNRYAESVLGWTTVEANEGDFLKKICPETVSRAQVTAYMESLEPGWHELETATKDGKSVPIEWASIRLSDDTRITIGVDLRERKKAMRALRESEKRLRMAIDSAYVMSFEWDIQQDEIRWFPPSTPTLASIAKKEFKTFEDIVNMIYPPDRKLFRINVQIALKRKDGKYKNEYRMVRPDGKIAWLYDSGSIEYDAHGQPLRLIGLSQDITERKETEEKLRQLNQTLEQKVAERTRLSKIRTKQLRALAVELIEAEEKERQRIAELLHEDLQQILASAKMQLQLACHKRPANPDLTAVELMLEESIKKSRRLSHELNPPSLHHFGLIPALEWLFQKMDEQFGLNIQFEVKQKQQFKNESLKICMFRSVQEILFNVVKHAGVKSARVELSGTNDDFIITISDQGRGFNPTILESSNVKSGLGLICLRERARAIGGSLKIESAPGRGSRFMLKIPCHVDVSAKSKGIDELTFPDHFQDNTESAAKGIKVLFVDDHKVMRQGLISMISGQPEIIAVEEAANGMEALEKTQHLHPDVVVMDISMPKMDGVEATRRIKAEFPNVRVIGLSMYEDEQTIQSILQAGAESFVSKTASPSELLGAIYGIKQL